MYNFKEFFDKNCNFKMLLEAYRGWHSEKPILYDYEDLDFLYQIDQKYWEDALKARYMKTWELLKNRENIRNKIIREMIDASKESGFLKVVKTPTKNVRGFKKSTKFNIDENNVNQFKEFLLKLSNKYDSYGNPVGSVDEKESLERKRWINDFFERYDIESVTPGGSKDNYKTIRNLIFDIIKRVVIYVKGGDEEKYPVVGGGNIKFYINRLIQKLETTEGETHNLKTKLVNLSKVYKKDMSFENKGKYGFDLSLPRRKTIITKNEEGKPEKETTYGFDSSGYYFPKSTGIRDSLTRLMSLNYQRHLPNEAGSGDLPSDAPDHSHEVKYKVIRSKMGKIKRYKDTFIFDVFQRKFYNQIAKFISNNSDINWYDDKAKEILEGSLDPEKEMEEINSGVWLVKSILNNPDARVEDANKIEKDLKKIFHGTVYGASDKKLYDKEVKDYAKKEDNKIGVATLRNITKFENVRKIRRLKDMFSSYFSKLRATDAIEKLDVSGPKILSHIETGDPEKDAELRKKELSLLDDKDRDELKTIIGEEDWERFIKTGRLPYKVDKDTKEILVGGENPPIILPHVTVTDENGTRSFPLLNPGSFVMPIKILSPEELEDIDKTKKDIQDSVSSYEELRAVNLEDDEELESLLNTIEKDPKYKNLDIGDFKQKLIKLIKIIKSQKEAESRKTTTSRSSSILGEKGDAAPVVQYHKADRYTREKGSVVPGHRPRSSMSMPSSPQEIRTMIGYYKIFSRNQRGSQPTTIINPRGGTLIDASTWQIIDKIFEKNPEKKPEKETVNPMKFYVYDIFNKAELDLDGKKQLESINLNNFILIKEFKINEAKEAYYEIEKSKDDSRARDQIEGWDDIVEGMKLFLLRKMYGGNELDEGIKAKYLKPKKFQDIHDEIAAEFVKEASSPTLWSPEARRIAAAGILGKIAQKGTVNRSGLSSDEYEDEEDEIKQVFRKKRTGQGVVSAQKSNELDIDPLDSNSKDILKLIFIDKKNPFIRRAQDGSRVALLRFGWRANPSEGIEQEDSIEHYIYKYSKLLDSVSNLLSGSIKTNKKVFDAIEDNLEDEKNNLLSFWGDFYDLALNSFNNSTSDKSTDSYKTILYYFNKSNEATREKVSSLYDNAKKQLLEKENIIVTSVSFDTKETIENVILTKIEDLKIIFNQINDIIKEDPQVKITPRPFTAKGRGPGVSKDETDEEYKERRKNWFQKTSYVAPIMPVKKTAMEKPIVYWARLIRELLVYLSHHTNKDQLTIQKFIAIKLGGVSRLSKDLKFPVHSFFDRIDKNIKDLSKVFIENKDKLSLSEKEKEDIEKNITIFSRAIPSLKAALFKSMQG
jgi:hypothetical protein